MRYTKGQSGNPYGRPKGSKNKTPEQLRAILNAFLSESIEDIKQEYNKLNAAQKLQYLDKLLCHVLPRPKDEIEKLTDEQLDIIIKKLKEEYGQ